MLDSRVGPWLEALETRHLANLTRAELTRALRALSSCYVERRGKLESGAALQGAGKRAAFALFYGPLHFLTIAEIVRNLAFENAPRSIADVGCGTGGGGAAWALAGGGSPRIAAIDRNAWAAAEANWTYRQLGVSGAARVGDAVRNFPSSPEAILLAYSVNEIPEPARDTLLGKTAAAVEGGRQLLVVEPIARRDRPWWPAWVKRLAPLGIVEREWRFHVQLPSTLRAIAKGAGLDPRELTARTLSR